MADLCDNLYRSPEHGWDIWVEKWSTLSIEDFLRSDKYQDKTGIQYRPWPQAAVEGFKVLYYRITSVLKVETDVVASIPTGQVMIIIDNVCLDRQTNTTAKTTMFKTLHIQL